jgi:hypothetical protein
MGWSLYFNPKAVQAVVERASQFPATRDSGKRYDEILAVLQRDPQYRPSNLQPVFPD